MLDSRQQRPSRRGEFGTWCFLTDFSVEDLLSVGDAGSVGFIPCREGAVRPRIIATCYASASLAHYSDGVDEPFPRVEMLRLSGNYSTATAYTPTSRSG